MSYDCDETADVYVEMVFRADRPHECSACKRTIPEGASYCKTTIFHEGYRDTYRRCGPCDRIYRHLLALCREYNEKNGDRYAYRWPDAALNCGLDYAEEWKDEPPIEIQEMVFRSPDEVEPDRADLVHVCSW